MIYYHRDIQAVSIRLAYWRTKALSALGARYPITVPEHELKRIPLLEDMMRLWFRRMDRWLGETSRYEPHQGARERARRRP